VIENVRVVMRRWEAIVYLGEDLVGVTLRARVTD
jgi:hypothetical protein